MNPKLYMIDASLLKDSDCQYKTHLIHDRGLTTLEGNFVIEYGTAGHKALAQYYRGEEESKCIQIALEHYLKYCTQPPAGDHRTIEHLADTLKGYFKAYPRGIDPLKVSLSPVDNITPLVEMPFAWPYYKDETKEVLICGTMDLKASYCGEKCIVDHKFTSVHYPERYFEGLRLNIQTAFYPWILRKIGIVDYILPVIINAIFLQKPSVRNNKKPGAQYLRSPFIQYTEEQLEEFEKWLIKRIDRIINETEYLPNYSRCETVYGKCQFFQLCQLKKKYREEFIEQNYAVREYNPLLFQV